MMEKLPTLYKETSSGATQVWWRELEGDRYRTVSGQINGAKTTATWTTCVGKNIGKRNETTPEQQARLECEADYKKKLAQGGYHESLEDIKKRKFFKPMLAEDYNKLKTPVSFPVFSQPKLDGVRAIATIDGLFSRSGKPIDSCPHIVEALIPVFKKYSDAVLDGELYADKLANDFNEIIRMVRKQKPGADHFAKTAAVIEYHVYDYPSCNTSYDVRRTALKATIESEVKSACIRVVDTDTCHTLAELDGLNAIYLQQGYEGQMVRIPDSRYEQKRVWGLLKRKVFNDDEFVVVSVNEGKGNRSGMAGDITYQLPDGRTFGSGLRGGFAHYKELLANKEKYEGGEGTVRFFGYTPDGIPRFPVTVALYPDGRDT